MSLLPDEGRVISIEDTLEFRLRRANCVRFEAHGLSGRDVTTRDLVRHALRHHPDHLVVGEVRGAEAADLLQALNTGPGGSLATVRQRRRGALAPRDLRPAGERRAPLGRGLPPPPPPPRRRRRHRADGPPDADAGGVRRVAQMVRFRDYDARENRWVVDELWPPDAAASGPPAKPPRRAPAKRQGRRRR